MELKIAFVIFFFGTLIFLAKIYPNMKIPRWQRRLVSAKYLRTRKHPDLANAVVLKEIEKSPNIQELYMDYFDFYASPENMKQLFDTVSAGYEKTSYPGLGTAKGWCYMEEGEFEKALELFQESDIAIYMQEHSLAHFPRLFYKKGDYERCEKEFISFHTSIYIDKSGCNAGEAAKCPEAKLLEDVSLDDIVILASARKNQDKKWRDTMSIIPIESIHEDECWTNFYKTIVEKKENFKLENGIYGSAEKMLSLKIEEFNNITDLISEYLGKNK